MIKMQLKLINYWEENEKNTGGGDRKLELGTGGKYI